MPVLHVNIDHVATVREARKIIEPDPVYAAVLCELAGASGITIHLREDRRHIQERDLIILRKTVKTTLNLEMAATDEMTQIALKYKPDMVTLVPEKREEVTTEGGLDVISHFKKVKKTVEILQENSIPVSLFINPDKQMIIETKECGAQYIELHTGKYCDSTTKKERYAEWEKLENAARYAQDIGIKVNAGHGLNYINVVPVAAIKGLRELNIGHSIIGRAIFEGMTSAVKKMAELIKYGESISEGFSAEDYFA